MCVCSEQRARQQHLAALVDVKGKYEFAKVSATVTSQATHLYLCQGVSVTPSGLLLSLNVPSGSLLAWIIIIIIIIIIILIFGFV